MTSHKGRVIVRQLCAGIGVFLLLVGLWAGTLPVLASSVVPSQPPGAEQKVFDQAGLFSEEEKTAFQARAVSMAAALQMDFAVVTTLDRGGLSAEQYTRQFYMDAQIGVGVDKEGVLLMLDSSQREMYVAAYTLQSGYLTDDDVSLLRDRIIGALTAGGGLHYYAGAIAFLDTAEALVKAKSQEALTGMPPLTVNTQQKVQDYAQLLSDEQKDALSAKIADIIGRTGADLVIVTATGTGGKGLMAFADDFYWDNGFGTDQSRSGAVLFVLAAPNSKPLFWVAATGKATALIDDQKMAEITGDITSALDSQGAYAGALVFLDAMDAHLSVGMRSAGFRFSMKLVGVSLAGGLAVGAIVVGIMFLAHRRSLPAAPSAQTYLAAGGMELVHQVDQFMITNTIVRPLPKDNGPGGGSTHRSSGGGSFSGGGSSGGSFSGGGGKF